ncbi:MAG: NAD(P)-binding protein, partial [Sinobacteraceae bacterium]|nr:NAD(P)-binding protein [Nevskiaceae bacterium]
MNGAGKRTEQEVIGPAAQEPIGKTGHEAIGREEPPGGVTRRDFVGGTLVGAGAALLGMASPAALREARAQTVASPMTGLGPGWTGPGGIGDYAHSNGNTHEVVNAAHGGIRNQQWDRTLRAATDTGERPDVVIVGCGMAGLSACWAYRKERPQAEVLMLDQHPIFGGEAKQNEFEVDGYHLTAPQGATGIVVPFNKAKDAGMWTHFATDLGFPDEFVYQKPTGLSKDILVPEDCWSPMHIAWERSDTGFYYEGKGWVINPWRDGFRYAPLAESVKKALVDMDLYRTPPRRADWERWLDSMTYLEFLRNVVGLSDQDLPEVTRYLNPVTAAMGCGLGADVISAYSAYNFIQPGVIGYYRYQTGGVDPSDEVYLASFPGGHAGTARHFLKKILPTALRGEYRMADILNSPVQWDQLDKPHEPVRMRLAATVVSVVHEGDPGSAKGVVVTYSKAGKLYRVHAKAAILCGQQHANRHICRDISAEYRGAMNGFHHAPMLTVNVAVRNWRFLEKLGIASARWFDGFGWWLSLRRNLEIPGQVTQPLDPAKPTVLTLYNPFPLPGVPFPQQCTAARMQLFNMSYAQIESAVRAQFTKLFGEHGFDANRDIAGIISNRWGHAYVVDPPGFFFGKDGQPAAKDILRKRFNRISFGHSELSGAQMWETAAEEGERA